MTEDEFKERFFRAIDNDNKAFFERIQEAAKRIDIEESIGRLSTHNCSRCAQGKKPCYCGADNGNAK